MNEKNIQKNSIFLKIVGVFLLTSVVCAFIDLFFDDN